MSENGESPPPAEQSQPSEAAESAPSGAGRQRTSDSWVMVEDPESKPAETYVSCSNNLVVAVCFVLHARMNTSLFDTAVRVGLAELVYSGYNLL